MKPTDNDIETDGGQAEFSFEIEESYVEETTGERIKTILTEYGWKPLLIAVNDKRTLLGGALLSLYFFFAFLAITKIVPVPEQNMVHEGIPNGYEVIPPGAVLQPFQYWQYPLGATIDGVGVFSMSVHATPNMLLMVASGAIWGTGLGLAVGTVAGYKGGTIDRVVTTFSDVLMSIPGLPLILVIAGSFSLGNINWYLPWKEGAIDVIGIMMPAPPIGPFIIHIPAPIIIGILVMINYWAGLARSIRSEVLAIREESFVEASRAMGVSSPKIIFKDVLPGIMPYVLVNFAFAARFVVFQSVGLYFLGVLPHGQGNWGVQLSNAYSVGSALVGPGAYHLILVPIIFIGGLGLSLVLLAQGLDKVFNPRVRTRMSGESEAAGEDDDDFVVGGGV